MAEEQETFIPENVASIIDPKIKQLIEVDKILQEFSKKMKPYKETKKQLTEDLTELFKNNDIAEYKINNKKIKLITRTKLQPIDDALLEKGVSEKIKNVNTVSDYKKTTGEIVENVMKLREKIKKQTINITNSKK